MGLGVGSPHGHICRMHFSLEWLQPRPQLRVTALILAVVLWWQLINFTKLYIDFKKPSSPTVVDASLRVVEDARLPCEAPAGFDGVFLVLRTGANEALEKLPAHFNTTLRCLPTDAYGIWSDLEEDIGGHHVQNALADVHPDIVANHPDFQYYRRLQEAGRAAFTAEELSEWAVAPNSGTGRDTPGWKLDKWKFLPVADKAYHQQPHAKWFVFMESDTYINWTNLLQWLSQIDSSKPYYIGNEMQIGDVVFAYGGSGFIISNPAMKAMVELRAAKADFYEEYTSNQWAGDCVLGKVMKDAGIGLSWQKPNLFDNMPYDMEYNSTFKDNRPLWCYYVTTYHHVPPTDIDEIFQFEKNWERTHSNLLRHNDVFRYLVRPKIGARVDEWESISMDQQDMKSTFEDCREACQEEPGCLQFVFYEDGQVCKTSSIFKLGHARQRDNNSAGRVASGWIMDRVDSFEAAMDASCSGRQSDWMLPD